MRSRRCSPATTFRWCRNAGATLKDTLNYMLSMTMGIVENEHRTTWDECVVICGKICMYVVIIYAWGKAQLPFHIPKDWEKMNKETNKLKRRKRKKKTNPQQSHQVCTWHDARLANCACVHMHFITWVQSVHHTYHALDDILNYM